MFWFCQGLVQTVENMDNVEDFVFLFVIWIRLGLKYFFYYHKDID